MGAHEEQKQPDSSPHSSVNDSMVCRAIEMHIRNEILGGFCLEDNIFKFLQHGILVQTCDVAGVVWIPLG